MIPKPPDHYIHYKRVSTEDQEESGLGLEAQEAILMQLYPNPKASFCDIQSGTTAIDRVELQKALEYCKKYKAYLIVAKTDRLSRSVRDALEIYDSLNERILFCDLPGDGDRLMITMKFAFAEQEALLISIRTKAANYSRPKKAI